MNRGEIDRESLLARCAGGDESALEMLYRSSAPQLFAVLLRILGRRDAAEDALQDVFVSVWENAARYSESRGRAMTWMISIARYRAIDIRRRRRQELSVEDIGDLDEVIAEASGDPALEVDRTADRKRLESCLGALSAAQRRCVSLAFLNGYTHPEIAAATGSPLGSVKSWVRRGLQSLKECLRR